MGIAWLLLRRTFATRPKRTFLFLLGYALSTAVMITLLAVGEAVVIQARDKNLLGGGDVILVPQGIDVESMKVGGTGALYYSIPQGRFIVRQLLGSSRFRDEIDVVSPYLYSQLLYVSNRGAAVQSVFAEGSIPDAENAVKNEHRPWSNNREDALWLHPDPAVFYHEIDHFHLPTVKQNLDRWAEWHYFNFEGRGFHGYLSIMLAGNPLGDRARWIVSLQLFDPAYRHFSADFPAARGQLPLERVDYSTGGSRVVYDRDHYAIELNFRDRVPIRGRLQFYPNPRLYFPPTVLAKSDSFESGYVIPAIRGRFDGSLQVAGKLYDFKETEGYHDHNWGIWQKTEWNWGHAFSDEYAAFFGQVFLNGKSQGLFAALFDDSGFLSVFRPGKILFDDYRAAEHGLRIPMSFRFSQDKPFASISLDARATSYTAGPSGEGKYFVQYQADYGIHIRLDGKEREFTASGNAETFLP